MWHKSTLEALLNNEKYTGRVIVGKSICDEFSYDYRHPNDSSQLMCEIVNNHPALISEELFNAVQDEKKNRSNIILKNGEYKCQVNVVSF